MPSITEVDNIKSLDDSGQTSILTKTGTGAGGDKVFTLDNVTLGSSVAGKSAAGNQILISTQTASTSSSIAFSSSLVTDTYDDYILDIANAVPSVYGGSPRIAFRISDGAADLTGCNTGRIYIQINGAASSSEHTAGAYTQIGNSLSNTVTDGGASSRVIMHGLRNTMSNKQCSFLTTAHHQTAQYAWHGGFELPTTSAIDYLRFEYSNGSTASGVFKLYGIKK